MIRPEELLDNRFLLWEQSIDGVLRSHQWRDSHSCEVQVRTQSPLLQNLLDQYRDAGWTVTCEENRLGTLCTFEADEL